MSIRKTITPPTRAERERGKTRGRVRYLVRWKEEGRHRGQRFDTLKEAQDFERTVMAEVARRRALGGFAPAEVSELPLRDYIRRAWKERADEWADSTKETWGDILDSWVLPLIGDVPLRSLNRTRVREFRASMVSEGVRVNGRRHHATPNRANAVMTVLSAFLGYAEEDELIPENPCRGVHRLPHKASKHRAHTPLVLERIRAQMTRRDALAVSLMYLAGLRPEEVLALQWRHVGERTLLIEQAATDGKVKGTKTGAGASVDLLPHLAADLAAFRAGLPAPPASDDYVIRGRQGDGVMGLRHWRGTIWHPARQAAKVGDATPYDCRHSFGSLLIHEGRDILEVQRAMRHASARTTLEHYAHEIAEWKGREKVALHDAVAEARHRAAAELVADPDDPSAGAGLVPPRPDVPPTQGGGRALETSVSPRTSDAAVGGHSPAAPSTEDRATAGVQELHNTPITGAPHLAENPDGERDGRYWARTSDPQLVELAQSASRDNTCTPEHDAEADAGEGDEPPVGAAGRPRLHESCTRTGRASHPTPRHPLGRCEDCGGALELGLEGTYCFWCDVRRLGFRPTQEVRELRQRRVPDLRRATEARRVNQRAVWMLAGAR